ncbi:lycopene cyclase domain-containing protein [Marisediminicola senii]|uniref:lycopene cyclase domain-containing protein n=1 Tax=Marisediminicola senii TaxID=2711233 RepID=UPI0013EBD84B|nr:lycopene cyclase domain-containing protein [Marisediminicola senii]
MTYWAMNAVFLAIVAGVGIVAVALAATGFRTGVRWASIGIAMGIVLVMTAIFDNVMIGVGLVAYDADKISGQFIGIAPLEDFAYAIAAVILLPSLWIILGRRPAGLGAGDADGAGGGSGGGSAVGPTSRVDAS